MSVITTEHDIGPVCVLIDLLSICVPSSNKQCNVNLVCPSL